jgi:hypothetical protein
MTQRKVLMLVRVVHTVVWAFLVAVSSPCR